MCILNGISQGIYQWLFVFLWALQPSPFFVGKIDGIPGGKETFWSGQHSSFKLPIHHQLVYNIPIFDGHITMFCWLNPTHPGIVSAVNQLIRSGRNTELWFFWDQTIIIIYIYIYYILYILYYILILYYIILYYIRFYSIILYYIRFYSIILYYIIYYYIILYILYNKLYIYI